MPPTLAMNFQSLLCLPVRSIVFRSRSTSASQKCRIFVEKGIKLPNYAIGKREDVPEVLPIQKSDSIKNVREACQIARKILSEMRLFVTPGMSTAYLETFMIEKCLEYCVYPSSLSYRGFPRCVYRPVFQSLPICLIYQHILYLD